MKKLTLNKKVISKLSEMEQKNVYGGILAYSAGCSDGCGGSSSLSSTFHCTLATCTADCEGGNSVCVCKTKDGNCSPGPF